MQRARFVAGTLIRARSSSFLPIFTPTLSASQFIYKAIDNDEVTLDEFQSHSNKNVYQQKQEQLKLDDERKTNSEKQLERLCRLNRVKEVGFLLGQLPPRDFKNADVYHFLRVHLVNAGDYQGVLNLDRGYGRIAKEAETPKSLIDLMILKGDAEAALVELRKESKINKMQFNRAVRSIAEHQGAAAILPLIDEMGQRKISVEMSTHDYIIQMYLEKKDTDSAIAYFDTIKKLGQVVDNRIYNNVINVLAQENKLKQAVSLIRDIKLPTKANKDTFIPVILAFAKLGDEAMVDKTMQLFEYKRVVPTRAYFNDLLTALIMGGLHKRVDRTLYKMRSHGFEPDIVSFNNILGGLAKTGNTEGVNHYLTTTLRNVTFNVGEYVPNKPGQFLTPTGETFHLIFEGYLQHKLYYRALEIFKIMRDKKVQLLPKTVPLIEKIFEETKTRLPLNVNEFVNRGDYNYLFDYSNPIHSQPVYK